jgi:uncharacterized Zn-binding protein involved in type VI secretion
MGGCLPNHRRTDDCTGHGCYPPRPLAVGSPNVFTNFLNQGRQTDTYNAHCCGPACHGGEIVKGSATVFANFLQVARQSDPVDCGSRCDVHSPDVFTGE